MGYYSNWYSISGYGISWCLCAHDDVKPPNLQRKYNRCDTYFDARHTLSCSKGGLIIACHNKMHGKLLYLAQRALTYAFVCGKPLIHHDHIILEEGIRHGSEILETRCDVLIQGLWELQTNAIIDVKIGDADADICMFEPTDKLLACWEKQKKDNNCNNCHEQRIFFYSFVNSIDGVLGKKALVVLANLSQLMPAKMDEPIFHVHVWINDRISITDVRSYSQMICGARPPVTCRNGIQTGTQNQLLTWRNKLRARIFPCAHPKDIFFHPRDPSLSYLIAHLVCAFHGQKLDNQWW